MEQHEEGVGDAVKLCDSEGDDRLPSDERGRMARPEFVNEEQERALLGSLRSRDNVPTTSSRREEDERKLVAWRRMLGVSIADWQHFRRAWPERVREEASLGIPEGLRGLAWQCMCGSRELLLRNHGLYPQLLSREVDYQSERAIAHDFRRTFPTHVFFRCSRTGQESLRNVLRCLAGYDTQIGYVQGMGFVVGALLLYMREEEAFWVAVAILKGYGETIDEPIERFYRHPFTTLNEHSWILAGLLEEFVPDLASRFNELGIVPSMYASQWFLTLFANSLPLPVVARIWDRFFAEGMDAIFTAAVALLRHLKDDIMSRPFEGVFSILKSLPSSNIDGNELARPSPGLEGLPGRVHTHRMNYRHSLRSHMSSLPIRFP